MGKKYLAGFALLLVGSACVPPGPDPTSNSGNRCHLDVDAPFFEEWGVQQVVAGATIECTQVADEISIHVVLEYETFWDWDELSSQDSSDFNVATHTELTEWGCKDRGNHNFKTVANGFVLDDAGTSLWGVNTQTSSHKTFPCNPPERP